MSVPSGKVVSITRKFAESLEAVWDAWTNPRVMRMWFGSDPNGVVLSAIADVQVGGTFEVTFANLDGSRYTCYGEYLRVNRPTRLTFTWDWKDRRKVTEVVDIEMTEEKGTTTMRFEHSNVDPDTTHDYERGWKTTFEKLERALGEIRER